MKKILIVLLVLIITLVMRNWAIALVSDLPDVGGRGYFYDITTGYTWMDVDNFYGLTYDQVELALSGTGYSIANYTQISQLHASLPGNSFNTWAPIIGYDRLSDPLVWGIFDINEATSEGWGWMYQREATWQYQTVTRKDLYYDDLGAWVVSTTGGGTVPEPSTMLLLGSGLIGLAGYGRKKFFKK